MVRILSIKYQFFPIARYYVPNLIQDGLFRGCSGMRGGEGGKNAPFSENLSHISYNDGTWNSSTLSKKDPKYIWITWHILEFCWHQQFFKGNQQILLYQEIHVEIAFCYKISNSFNFSWVFKNCFNKQVTILMILAIMATPGQSLVALTFLLEKLS